MSVPGPSIRWLLLGANVFVTTIPLLALGGLRIYDTYLVRQTERQLIAQAVVIGEAWRELWLEEVGAPALAAHKPPGREADAFVPVEPVLDLSYGISPPQPEAVRLAPAGDTPVARAAGRLAPLLSRAQTFNLSAVRILDASGCVVATTRGEAQVCLDELPEVARALAGQYAAVARVRETDEPLPPLGSVRSRGSIRVFIALPVFASGRVVAVVRASRTSLDALTSLWHSRRGLLLVTAATLAVMLAVSAAFAAVIARPVRAITRAARAVASGEPHAALVPRGFAPREIRALSASLDVMTQRLRARADYVAEFAAAVSHELKTPLAAIRGAVELLRDSWAAMPEAQRARFLANVDADAERMERLATRLLQLARIEASEDEGAPIDVRAFFAALGSRLDARVSLTLADPPATVTIDPDHLASAVTNLVDNALRHGGDAPVGLRVGRSGERLAVEVEDHGAGVSPANRTRLFQRFFTTERDRGGTGLGLSIVKAIAERRGGEVRFETRPGCTRFTLVV